MFSEIVRRRVWIVEGLIGGGFVGSVVEVEVAGFVVVDEDGWSCARMARWGVSRRDGLMVVEDGRSEIVGWGE